MTLEVRAVTNVAQVDNHDIGGEQWVSLRVRGAEFAVWLKPEQAAELGRVLLKEYGVPSEVPEQRHCRVVRDYEQ